MVAVLVIVISVIPVYFANRLTRRRSAAVATRGAKAEPVAAEATAVP